MPANRLSQQDPFGDLPATCQLAADMGNFGFS
jgi:hypothetical protein